MKRLLLSLTALAALTALKAQVNMLTPQRQGLAAIAALEAKGDLAGLSKAIDEGLDNGLTVAQVKEALSQLYAYTGFPRSLNALGTLQRVVAEREASGKATTAGEDGPVLPEDFDSLAEGTRVQTQLTGTPFNYEFCPREDYYLKAHLFGDIFSGKALDKAEREIVTVSAISVLEGCAPQLASHARGSLNMGVTEAELRALPSVLEEKVGAVEAWRLRKAIAGIFNEESSEGAPVDFNIWPKGEPNTAYAEYFIGNSYLAPMDAAAGGPVNVTFEPGCRNNWHIHRKGVQVLICVAGRGWYQEWGKEPVEMTPGTVIAIPAEAKHWHGAAKDSWFQHLTYTTRLGEGASNEWLEPVTDEVYGKLR